MSDIVVVKLLSCCGFFVVTLFSAHVPSHFPSGQSRAWWIRLANSFSAGMLAFTALVHLLPHTIGALYRANADIEDLVSAAGWRILAGIFIPFFCESVLIPWQARHDPPVHGHSHGHRPYDPSLSGCMFALLLAVHSIIEGLTLGVLPSQRLLVSALPGMLIHKCCDGIMVGTALLRNETEAGSRRKILMTFSAATPLSMMLGVALGVGSRMPEWFSTALQQICVGTFLFLVLVEILPYAVASAEIDNLSVPQRSSAVQRGLEASCGATAGVLTLWCVNLLFPHHHS